jgi:ankyrin repeat protein
MSNTALLQAAWDGNVSGVRAELDLGADVDARIRGFTALMAAAAWGCTDTVRLLLDRGADIEARIDGWTALMFAAFRGHTETVRLLLDSGADINAQDYHTGTVLIGAAKGGNTETMRLLLDRGVDVNARDKRYGMTALEWAAEYDLDPRRDIFDRTEIVRLLLDYGAQLWEPGYSKASDEIKIMVEECRQTRAAIVIQKYMRRFLVLEKVTNPTHEWGYKLLMARFERYSEESW